MLKKLVGGLVSAGLAVVLAACGAANPVAVAIPVGPEVDGLASASGVSLPPVGAPGDCGMLALSKVEGGSDWATVQAQWVSDARKGFLGVCPAPTFSVSPEAKMFVARYDRSRMTFWAGPGTYTVVAQGGSNVKPAILEVDLK
jgi:hypothetical protein